MPVSPENVQYQRLIDRLLQGSRAELAGYKQHLFLPDLVVREGEHVTCVAWGAMLFEAIIFVPLLYIANEVAPQAIPAAGVLTLVSQADSSQFKSSSTQRMAM